MANIKSNAKRNRKNKKTYVSNHSNKSAMKTQIKKTKKSKSQKDLNTSYKKIDSNLSKGIITQNKANRLKSRLANNVNSK